MPKIGKSIYFFHGLDNEGRLISFKGEHTQSEWMIYASSLATAKSTEEYLIDGNIRNMDTS